MVTRLWSAACGLLFAAAVAAHEGHGGHAEAAATSQPRSAAAKVSLGATASFAADGGLWAASKEGGHVVVRQSLDRGRHWSPPLIVNPQPEAVAAEGDARPKLAVGPGGELYVSWTKPLAKPYTGEVRFARSLDGKTFEAPLTVHRDRQEITHRFDALAVTPQGQIFVAWIDKRDLELAKKAGRDYRGAAIYFAVSSDRGASFQAERKVADASCECCRIALAGQADGSVLALWRHVFAPNVRDHALARLRPDGSSEPLRRATFDDWRTDACPHHGPGLAVDATGVTHAVWYSGGGTAPGVHYGRLAAGRVDAQRRLGGSGAVHADIAAAGARVALVWKEFDGQRTRLRAELSADGGASWQARELGSTDGASDQPRLLAQGGRFLVFWNTAQTPFATYELD